jgi:streptomycin 6-kinase
MFYIPDDFKRDMVALHGQEDGQAWLDRLPDILADCERRWNITIEPPIPNLSFNYVAPARRAGGARVIVKATSPTGEFGWESEALRLCDGHGMAQLLDAHIDDEVMLLEYLYPGTLLRGIEDDELATSIAAAVMRDLWRPAPEQHSFKTVQDWGKGFDRLRQRYNGGSGPFRPALLEEAETLYAELCASMTTPVLLHGDLHHDNILAAERRPWLAIDPKGVIGEAAYETGSWLRNPYPGLLNLPQPGRVLARRIDQFAEELGFERARIRDWALAQAVLSDWWGIEDYGFEQEDMLAVAELLAAIKP